MESVPLPSRLQHTHHIKAILSDRNMIIACNQKNTLRLPHHSVWIGKRQFNNMYAREPLWKHNAHHIKIHIGQPALREWDIAPCHIYPICAYEINTQTSTSLCWSGGGQRVGLGAL